MSASTSVVASPGAPRDVKVAVALFAAALIIRIVEFALQRAGVTSVPSEGLSSPVSLALGTVMTVGFLSSIITGKNWGRIMFAVLMAVGLLVSIPIVRAEIVVDPARATLSLLQMVLNAAGLFFVFRPDSNRWFRHA